MNRSCCNDLLASMAIFCTQDVSRGHFRAYQPRQARGAYQGIALVNLVFRWTSSPPRHNVDHRQQHGYESEVHCATLRDAARICAGLQVWTPTRSFPLRLPYLPYFKGAI